VATTEEMRQAAEEQKQKSLSEYRASNKASVTAVVDEEPLEFSDDDSNDMDNILRDKVTVIKRLPS